MAAMKLIGSHPFPSGFGDSPYHALDTFRFTRLGGDSVLVGGTSDSIQKSAGVVISGHPLL
jgi:hypothetical protein